MPLVIDDETPIDEAEFVEYYSPFGNATTGHYSQTAADNMHKIAIPTLICLAEDDPVAPVRRPHASRCRRRRSAR